MRSGRWSQFATTSRRVWVGLLREARARYGRGVPRRPRREVPERVVRCLWYDGRYRKRGLRTADGRAVRVISPGRWNLDAGPDFLGARIAFGNGGRGQVPPVRELRGDVEIHLRTSDWRAHRHHLNPGFNRVILQIVLRDDRPRKPVRTSRGRPVPLLALGPRLTVSLAAFAKRLDGARYPYAARRWRRGVLGEFGGNDAARAVAGEATRVAEWLDAAADERFRLKVARIHRWARRRGWAGALSAALDRQVSVTTSRRTTWGLTRVRPAQDPRRRLGGGRLRSLMFNAVLPFLYAKARSEKDAVKADAVRAAWRAWPPLPEHRIGRIMSAHLWGRGGPPAGLLSTESRRQGVLHLFRTVCQNGMEDCGAACPVVLAARARQRNL